ncbi:MAG: InlB B-repeat-containing protein [Clostridia bacterium]|nr:InlB B-repeat-containing protein [Clostridia bacterium]
MMKRIMACLLMLAMMLHGAAALADEAQFYLVQYDANGHGDAPQMQTKNPGDSVKLSTSRMDENFYVFVGWATDPEATEAAYMPGDLYEADADVTLYAIWREPEVLGEIGYGDAFELEHVHRYAEGWASFTVKETGWYRLRSVREYLKSTGLGSASIGTRRENSKYMNTLANAEYDWQAYEFSVTAELEAGVTYYLRFYGADEPLNLEVDNDFYTVTYDANGHGDAPQMQTKNPGDSVKLSTSRMDEDFYVFVGWATEPEGTQAAYMPGDLYEADADVTLYAIWREPEELGEITDEDVFELEHVHRYAEGWASFTVKESGWHRLRSIGEYLKSTGLGSASIGTRRENSKYMNTLASAEYNWQAYEFSVTAELEPGVTYYLRFYGADEPLNLVVESRYRVNKAEIDLVLPSLLEGIESEAFAGGAFGNVYCPETVKAIGARAFADCAALREVAIAAADVQIDAAAFDGCGEIVIIAPRGSTAHEFATENGLEFREIAEE